MGESEIRKLKIVVDRAQNRFSRNSCVNLQWQKYMTEQNRKYLYHCEVLGSHANVIKNYK